MLWDLLLASWSVFFPSVRNVLKGLHFRQLNSLPPDLDIRSSGCNQVLHLTHKWSTTAALSVFTACVKTVMKKGELVSLCNPNLLTVNVSVA